MYEIYSNALYIHKKINGCCVIGVATGICS